MSNPTLASVDDLALHLNVTLDSARAQLELENATALIQAECDQLIFQVVDDIVLLPGVWERELWLPERPVTAVGQVKVNALTLNAGEYAVHRSGQLYRGPLPVANGPDDWDEDLAGEGCSWGGPLSVIEVKYTHGYEVVPADLRALCLAVAARAYLNATGTASETAGNYSRTNEAGATPGAPTDSEKKICARYRRDVMSISMTS